MTRDATTHQVCCYTTLWSLTIQNRQWQVMQAVAVSAIKPRSKVKIRGVLGGIRGYMPYTNLWWFFWQRILTSDFTILRSALFLLEGFWGPEICLECVGAPDSAGGVHDAPPNPQVSWGEVQPPQHLISGIYPPIFLVVHHWLKYGTVFTARCTSA